MEAKTIVVEYDGVAVKREEFTEEEIAARERVWLAAVKTESGVALSAAETKALWSSILKSGVEIAGMRDVLKKLDGRLVGAE